MSGPPDTTRLIGRLTSASNERELYGVSLAALLREAAAALAAVECSDDAPCEVCELAIELADARAALAKADTARSITVWACDECPYWRKEKKTGVHMTTKDPGGRLIAHQLRPVEFVAARVSDAAGENNQ